MTVLNQIRIQWNGLAGMPGVSTFYRTDEASVSMSTYKAFFDALVALFPVGLKIAYPTSGVKIDTATGQATGTWSAGAQTETAGTATAPFAAPCGALVNWHTGAYVGGRELRGKTFLVPIASTGYQTDGTLDPAFRSAIQNAATTLVTNGTNAMSVYSRKSNTFGAIITASVPDKVVVLRSRRD